MILKSKKFKALVASLVVMTSMVGCSAKSNTENTEKSQLSELTITHVTSPLNVPSIVQKTNNVFEEEFKNNGMDIKVNYAEITSGADQTQALASGDVDILYAVGGSSVISAAANGADIKILNMYSRSPEAFCMYSKDASIKSAEDLRGKTIAGPYGTNLHELLVSYLEKAGMTIEDVNFVKMSIGEAKTALDTGNVDVALVAGPTAYQAKQEGYNLVTNGKGLTDALIAVAVSESFYNEHKDVVDAFIKGEENVLKFINENHDEAMEIVAKELELDKAAVEEMFTQYDFNMELTEADKEAFKNLANFMHKTEMIEEEFDVNTLFLN